MKVEISTKEKTVMVHASDVSSDIATVDKWIKALKVAREWLRKELEQPK